MLRVGATFCFFIISEAFVLFLMDFFVSTVHFSEFILLGGIKAFVANRSFFTLFVA